MPVTDRKCVDVDWDAAPAQHGVSNDRSADYFHDVYGMNTCLHYRVHYTLRHLTAEMKVQSFGHFVNATKSQFLPRELCSRGI